MQEPYSEPHAGEASEKNDLSTAPITDVYILANIFLGYVVI
jgi:hypothetical protein